MNYGKITSIFLSGKEAQLTDDPTMYRLLMQSADATRAVILTRNALDYVAIPDDTKYTDSKRRPLG